MKYAGTRTKAVLRISVLALSVCLICIGCSRGGGNPVDPGAGMDYPTDFNLTRSAQDFDTNIEWGEGLTLDSTSAMWIPPHPGASVVGTVAVCDDVFEVDILLTAVAKAEVVEENEDTEIVLRVDDSTLSSTPFYTETFSAGSGITGYTGDAYCRHPTVEASCWRIAEEEEGIITVYVIWSQLSMEVVDEVDCENWDLYANVFYFTWDDTGVDNTPSTSGPFALSDTKAYDLVTDEPFDELQPDLAMANNGDLLLVYVVTDSAAFINAALFAYRADWNSSTQTYSFQNPYYILEAVGGYPYPIRISPSVDVGRLTSVDANSAMTGVCAWFEEKYYGPSAQPKPYQIWYCIWNIEDDSVDIGDIHILTFSESEANALVSVDIPSDAPGAEAMGTNFNDEAVIAWTNFDYSVTGSSPNYVRHYEDPHIQFTVTPYPASNIEEISGVYGIAPDVACYERCDTWQNQWFGLCFYEADTGGDIGDWDWDMTRIRSYSWNSSYDFSYHYEGSIEYAPAFWALGVPFTCPTICLRDPSVGDIGSPPDSEPYNDIFSCTMIQENSGDRVVWVSEGEIDD